MKNKMNITFTFAVLVMFAFSFNFVSAAEDACTLSVDLINQDSYPAVPGSYVELVFQMSGLENSNCDGAIFVVNPSYPFSLDEDDGIRSLSSSTYISGYKTDWMIPIKLRVDEDALDGNMTLNVMYGENSATSSKDFDVEIEDARTSFDAVVQDSTDEEVSIAIANTGKYTANSVVVRIPEQNGFTATSTDGQMVGNLDSGDYTIVTFAITQDMRSEDNGLDFDIYYTDSLGERRVVPMELGVGSGSSEAVAAMSFENGEIPENVQARMSERGMMPGQTQSNSSEWIKWTIIVVAGLVVMVGIGIIFKKRKKSKITKKAQNKKSSGDAPDWMKNSKVKDKG